VSVRTLQVELSTGKVSSEITGQRINSDICSKKWSGGEGRERARGKLGVNVVDFGRRRKHRHRRGLGLKEQKKE